jgi:DNA-binding transcriptional regulator LsrR (DeoR family)
MNNQNTRLMIKVARLYYENNLTQDEISKRLRISRPRVSRLMQEARETGVVQIKVASLPGDFAEMERQIEEQFSLTEVIVVDVPDPTSHTSVAHELGAAAADYFRRAVQDGDVIGLTWGETLAGMVDNLLPEKKQNVVVCQLVGGLGDPASETHSIDLARRTSLLLDATLNVLPAPGIVSTLESARLLKEERFIAQALQLARRSDIVFAGIGALSHDAMLMRDESIVTWNEVNPLIARGAVGEIGLRFFDIDGNPVPSEVDERVIGIEMDQFRSLPCVVAVAGGVEKEKAILGAVRGHFIKTLITDVHVAQYLLNAK